MGSGTSSAAFSAATQEHVDQLPQPVIDEVAAKHRAEIDKKDVELASLRAKLAELEPRWNPHGPEMVKDAPAWTQESAKIIPRWPSWSQDGDNMTPRG